MKVRQSVSVTSELGDPNNLASFDGEIRAKPSSTLGVELFSLSDPFLECVSTLSAPL